MFLEAFPAKCLRQTCLEAFLGRSLVSFVGAELNIRDSQQWQIEALRLWEQDGAGMEMVTCEYEALCYALGIKSHTTCRVHKLI